MSCAIIPSVKNKETNKLESSRLFKNLLHLTEDRGLTKLMYKFTKDSSNFNKDSLGESFIGEVLTISNNKELIGRSKITDKLTSSLGYKKYTKIDNEVNKDILEKTKKFNTGDYQSSYVAIINNSYEDGIKRKISVEEKTPQTNRNSKLSQADLELNIKIKGFLNKNGIAVGALTKAEEKMGALGVTDFSVNKKIGENLIELIRIAKGKEGQGALVEEFSHFIIEALQENPFIDRMKSALKNKDIYKSILGEELSQYAEEYKNNEDYLITEALGKVLTDVLNNTAVDSKVSENLMDRLKDAVKAKFKHLNEGELRTLIRDVYEKLESIAKEVHTGNYNILDNLNTDIKSKRKYFRFRNKLNSKRAVIEEILEKEQQRLDIWNKKKVESLRLKKEQETTIANISKKLENAEYDRAILRFLNVTSVRLNRFENVLHDLDSMELNDAAKILRESRQFLLSIEGIIGGLLSLKGEEAIHSDIKDLLGEVQKIIFAVDHMYATESKDVYFKFLKTYFKDEIVIPKGKRKGERVSIEDFALLAEEDITYWDMLVDSMSNSNNLLLRVFQDALVQQKDKERIDTSNKIDELKKAHIKLEEAGEENTHFMYERDSKGELTGYFVSNAHIGNFVKARDSYKESIKDKPKATQKTLMDKWYKDNTVEDLRNNRVPDPTIYPATHSLNKAQQEYYDVIMKYKRMSNNFIGMTSFESVYSIPKISKDALERLGTDDNAIQSLVQEYRNSWVVNKDDIEFGTGGNTVLNFEGKSLKQLPVFFVKLDKRYTLNDITLDTTSSMMSFLSMANNVHHLQGIIHLLENARDVLGDNYTIQNINDLDEESLVGKARLSVSKKLEAGSSSNIMKKLDSMFETQIYGNRQKRSQGAILTNKLIRYTALKGLGLNVLNGIANVATGLVQGAIEAGAGEYFSHKDLLTADSIFIKELGGVMADVGKRVQISKMNLWDKLFDFSHHASKEEMYSKMRRNSKLGQLASLDTAFAPSSMGEYYLALRTSLAMAQNYILKDNFGNTYNLWEAMEVEYLDKDNPQYGARLVVKNGLHKEDGSEFTQEDVSRFARKVTSINHGLHGIYNEEDSNMLNQYALGRLVYMFRKHVPSYIHKRFGKLNYNTDLKEWQEGYFRSCASVLKQAAIELKEGTFELSTFWDQVSDLEKANIKRASYDISIATLLLALSMTMFGLGKAGPGDDDDDDDYERGWDSYAGEYLIKRLTLEMNAYSFNPIQPSLTVSSNIQMIKQPTAALPSILSALQLLNFMEEGKGDTIPSGAWQGYTQWEKELLQNIPIYSTLKVLQDPKTKAYGINRGFYLDL